MKSNKKWSMLTLIMMFWFTISFLNSNRQCNSVEFIVS